MKPHDLVGACTFPLHESPSCHKMLWLERLAAHKILYRPAVSRYSSLATLAETVPCPESSATIPGCPPKRSGVL